MRVPALALTLLSLPWLAAAGELVLRVPNSVLQKLAQPETAVAPNLSESLLKTNPWAASAAVTGDLMRFRLSWRLTGDTEISLTADRQAAQRMARGLPEDLERYFSVPEGYSLKQAAVGPEGLAATIQTPPEPAELPAAREVPPGLLRSLGSHMRNTLRLLGSQRYVAPTLGAINPDNKVLEIPDLTTEAEARLDLSFEWDPVSLSAKPRARWTLDHWDDGPRSGDTDSDTDLLLLEGLAKVRLWDSLFVSYGRENLQWGPGQLVSPSNPFFVENGRDNPVREISGMDFARAVWLPAEGWTVSWIQNTGKGEYEPGYDWHPSYAFKADYVSSDASGAVLFYEGRDENPSFRGYGQWTVSDALLAYGEASFSRGTRALYPSDGALEPSRKDDPAVIPSFLLGSSYTLESGPTVYLEYYFNGEGLTQTDADHFFTLAHEYGAAVDQGLLPSDTDLPGPRRKLLRRNYLFFQYLQTEIGNKLDVIARWAQNLDDGSALVTGFAEYALSDRWRLFGYGAFGTGGNRDEFGSVVRFSATLGLELSAF